LRLHIRNKKQESAYNNEQFKLFLRITKFDLHAYVSGEMANGGINAGDKILQ